MVGINQIENVNMPLLGVDANKEMFVVNHMFNIYFH